jgi:hypothetical protein
LPDERGESVAFPDHLGEGAESIASLVYVLGPLPHALRVHLGRESMASLLVVEVSFAVPAGCMVTIVVYFAK